MADITIINSLTCDPSPTGAMAAAVPLGPLYIVSSLEAAGYHVQFMDYQLYEAERKPSIATFTKFLSTVTTRIVGINLYNSSLPTVLGAVTEFKRQHPDSVVILGGPSATDSPSEILAAFPAVDYIVCGEGELTTVELMQAIESNAPPHDIPGIAWRNNGTTTVNAARDRVKDVDSLPWPAYHHLDLSPYGKLLPMMTARGCPYRCTFCSKGSIWKNEVTYRSPENIVKEMEHMQDKIADLMFLDDTFILQDSRVRTIIDGMRSIGLSVPWRCNGRVDKVNVDLVKHMVDSGCQEMLIGLESGSDTVLSRVKKRFSRDQALACARTLSQIMPLLDVSFIWGFPFETVDDLYDTLSALGEISRLPSQKRIHGHLLCAFPGSPLYQEFSHLARFSLDLYPTQRAFVPSDRLSSYPELLQLITDHPRIMAGFYHYDHPELASKAKVIDQIWPDTEGR